MYRAVALIAVMIIVSSLPGEAFADQTLDDQVQAAIKKGVEFLWSKQDSKTGLWEPYDDLGIGSGGNYHPIGNTVIVMQALLECGESIRDPRMVKAVSGIRKHISDRTYTLGIRAQVWQLLNQQSDGAYLKEFLQDVEWLVRMGREYGGYGYGFNYSKIKGLSPKDYGKHFHPGGPDNSNAQYGVLGVWAGSRSKLDITMDADYWYKVYRYWVTGQNPDGGWGYTKQNAKTTHTMTAAGVATLFVCYDNLFAEAFTRVGMSERHIIRNIERGLEWFDKNFARSLRGFNPYFLYGVERVGLACGYKYFGTSDWYKMGAKLVIKAQRADGSWTSSGKRQLSNTAFCLLFLARGRNPVLFNKLIYDGDWNNRPRALANLTYWISQNYEVTVAWQIINLKVPVEEWHDAPILHISGARAPTFADEEIDKLREYCNQGGTLFVVAEGGRQGQPFSAAMKEIYKKMFPDYPLESLPENHSLFNAQYNLNGKPPMSIVSNGGRPLIIHCEEDLPLPWQTYRLGKEIWAYETGMNVAMYVTDKGSMRARGVPHWPAKASRSHRAITVARIRHNGNWNPEPFGLERVSRIMSQKDSRRLEVKDINATELMNVNPVVAFLTGTGTLELSDEECQAIKTYVENGGTILVDATGGDRDFSRSSEDMLIDVFDSITHKLDSRAPIFNQQGMAVDQVRFRRRTSLAIPERTPRIRTILVNDRPGVLHSSMDITCGLIGVSSFDCDGYASESAVDLVRAIITYAEKNR